MVSGWWRAIAVAVGVVLAAPASAQQVTFDDFSWRWQHQAPFWDIPPGAVMDRQAFDAWRPTFRAELQRRVDAVAIAPPLATEVGPAEERGGYTLQRIGATFQGGQEVGSVLAVPERVDPEKPIVIAIHGHEVPPRGEAPLSLFGTGWWPERLLAAGYVVWAPSHLWYEQLAPHYEGGDFHIVWLRMLDRLLTAALPHFPAHDGLVAAGVSAGGRSASFLMAYRPDIKAGVFAATFVSLDWLRENYRYQGVPNAWDMRGLLSYLPMYALLAPRRAEWQLGERDSYYPDAEPNGPVGCCFPGTPRPISTTDTLGEFYIVRQIWSLFDSDAARLHLHDGGHDMDVPALLAFLADL